MLLSLVPIAIFIKNAEAAFKMAGVKSIASNRRERLDKEHNVDRKVL